MLASYPCRMKTPPAGPLRPRRASTAFAVATLAALALPGAVGAHLPGDPSDHPAYDWSVRPTEKIVITRRVAQNQSAPRPATPTPAPPQPAQAAAFAAFAPRVSLRWDDTFLYVEGKGLPAHPMMIGITAWQQQVPLPQAYTGANAWRIPLQPVVATRPQPIRDHFLRGAIALAANGIPIFNPQNNRGEVAQEIGELDQWGGLCGRADDYHYHAAPLHLQSVLGPNLPIAFALDGYPIYGLTEPDGAAPEKLDAYNGHATPALGYHYHGSMKYPYVNGGFHGEVVEREGQVDPQPRAQPVRESLPPLRGAKITGFSVTPDEKSYAVDYTVNGRPAAVRYTMTGPGEWKFGFEGTDGQTRFQTYQAGQRAGGGSGGGRGERPPGKKGRPPGDRKGPPPEDAAPRPLSNTFTPARSAPPGPAAPAAFSLRSPVVTDGGNLPVEFTGDGASRSPPLTWSDGPAGTQSYAVIMHHLDPEGKTKWYWTLYNIPADVHELAKNTQGVGRLGNNSVNRRIGYAPPHSKGPGAKTYTLTVYALSQTLNPAGPAAGVNRDVLLAAMKDITLASAELKVVYTRDGLDR